MMLPAWLAAACSSGGGTGADGGGGANALGGAGGSGGPGGAGGNGANGGASGSAAGATAGTSGSTGAGGGSAPRTVVYISGSSSTLSIFTLDLATGVLTPAGTASGGTSPTYLAWDPAKRFLFAGNGGQGRATAFAIDPASGALTRLGDASTAGMGYMAEVTHLSVHPTGRWLLVDHFDSGHVAVLPIAADGTLGAPADIQRPAPEAHQIVSDASGRHVFVPCRSGNIVAQYGFDAQTGKLTPASPPSVPASAGAGPRHMAFHPNGKWAYVINELNGTMTSFQYDAAAGLLSAPETVSTVPAGVTETAAAHVVVHPSGKFVYGSNRTHNSVAIFGVDATTGRLSVIGHETGGGVIKTPRDFGVDPSGQYLIVANMGSSSVVVFRIDGSTGTLSRIGGTVSVPSGPQFVGPLTLP
jgi:6-phosphogluconolactonase